MADLRSAAPFYRGRFYLGLRAFSFIALAAIAIAIVYTAWISIANWTGIGV
jgi:hypothetical protein